MPAKETQFSVFEQLEANLKKRNLGTEGATSHADLGINVL